MPNFRDEFRPQRGDIIYGKKAARDAYFDQMQSQEQRRAILEDKALWGLIDQYNNYYVCDSVPQQDSPENVASGMKARQDNLGKAPFHPDAKEQQVEQRTAYYTQIQKSRYSPTTVYSKSVPTLQKEGFKQGHKNQFGETTPFTEERAARANRLFKMIRQACKFGIGLLATDPSFAGQGAKIHFVLDGINMLDVIAKSQSKLYNGQFAVPITWSELRYVYRNWDRLKGTVQFYVNLETVAPPWQEDWSKPSIAAPRIITPTVAHKAEWQHYAEARDKKYPGGLPNKSLI